MFLSVFFEFSKPDLLESFAKLCPNVRIDKPTHSLNDKNVSDDLNRIHQTNAKLFYTETDNVDDILDKLQLLGFKIIDRNPLVIYKEKQRQLVPDEKYEIEYKKCDCGKSNIQLPRKMIEKIVTVEVKRYLNDRIILEIELS